MRIIRYYFLLFIICQDNFKAQIMWQLAPDTYTKWFLQMSDEFDGSRFDSTKWRSGYPWGRNVMNLDLLYLPQNILVDNGALSLITKKEKVSSSVNVWDIDEAYLTKYNKKLKSNNEYDFEYTGGALSSINKFKYGYFEIRFKANKERGIWPAFWLFGGEPNEEIDFYEGKGERGNQVHIDMHCPEGCDNYRGGFLNLKKNWGAWIKLNDELSEGWNIISGEWQPGYVKFFLNGTPIGYFSGNLKTSQYLIINSAVAKNGEAFKPGPDDKTVFPNAFMLDYVRVWNNIDSSILVNNTMFNFDLTANTIANNQLYSTQPKSKANFIYNKKVLDTELGFITLLPVGLNKYSLSIVGKKIGNVKIEITDLLNNNIISKFSLDDVTYYTMDLNHLPKSKYTVVIKVLGQILTCPISIN